MIDKSALINRDPNIENQDMLLACGIFRDVYLIESRKNTLLDYRVTTTYSSITVTAKLSVASKYKVKSTLDGESVEYLKSKHRTHREYGAFVIYKHPRFSYRISHSRHS
ncbi:MAG: hypothetical protein IJW03_02280 [Clostridia bacterium]|nr:hypothetical protein [Clostridia bacterium]